MKNDKAYVKDSSALIIRLPELDRIIAGIRYLADVPESIFPAHVTVMAPFPSIKTLTPEQIQQLKNCCDLIKSFDFTLDGVSWFSDEVVYFKIKEEEKFLKLTEIIGKTFHILPYEGRHTMFVPHVTVALNDCREHLSAAARIAEACVPVYVKADSVVLWEKNSNGVWCSTINCSFS